MKKSTILPLLAATMLLSSCSLFEQIKNIFNREDTSESDISEDDEYDWHHEEREDVIPANAKKYTILMYVCGSTLEYDSESKRFLNYATEDLQEILSVSNQPNDVNIVIETGGSQKWSSALNIDPNYLQRYHVADKRLVLDSNETKANMGESQTLEDFVDWGIRTYPAEKYGLILWNHGGAVHGVCYDDNYKDAESGYWGYNALKTSEVYSAVDNALAKNNRNKLEWIGYDACIMSYLDLASANADIAKYMVSSQELENAGGWDYDQWLPTLYNNPSVNTVTLLSKICDTFVDQYGSYDNDQTLSVLDLSKMDNFTENFEDGDFSSLKTILENSLTFGEDVYGLADFSDFINRAKTTFSNYSTDELIAAFNGVVVKNKYGSSYNRGTKPCGVNIFLAYSPDKQYGLQVFKSDYTDHDTKFSAWRKLNEKNGFK